MKPAYLIATAAVLSLLAPAAISATPQRVTVPAHFEYCVMSKPVPASAYELPEVREALFQELYKQIEQAALAAQLPSMGVAFVDAIMQGANAQEVPATGVPASSAPSQATYVVRECAVVPARGAPPLPTSGFREVPERSLYATICAPASIEACKRDLEKVVRPENTSPSDALRPIIFRTRPALSSDDSVDNLVASMSDAKLRKLKDSAQSVSVQDNLVILSAELGVAGN
jgi:hypothetical protein